MRHVLILALVLTACGGKNSGRPGGTGSKPGQSPGGNSSNADFANVQSPELAKLDLSLQNTVFRSIMDAAKAPTCTKSVAEKADAHLITNDEYMQTLADVFGLNADDKTIKDQLLVESKSLGFRNLKGFGLVSPDRLKSLFAATEVAIGKIIETRRDILQCGQGQGSPCVRTFLQNALPSLWKKTVSSQEIDALIRSFEGDGGDSNALQILLQRLLVSPYMVFRSDLGTGGRLGPVETANILASVIWSSAPDAALLAKANAGAWNTPESLGAEIKAMLADPRALRGIHQFVMSWLETDRLNAASKTSTDALNMTPEIKQELALQTTDFLMHLIQIQQDTFANIFAAPFTIVSDRVAQYYGWNTATAEAVQVGNRSLKKVALGPESKGLFGQGGFISSLSVDGKTHIATRGSFILSKMLCHNLEVPPNLSSSATMAAVDPNLNVREGLTQLTAANSCAGCHAFINGVGFALEGMSAFGRIRTQDDLLKPLLLDSTFTTLAGASVQVSGANGLADSLAQSEQAQLCLVTQLFRKTYNRLETSADACTIATVYKEAKAGNLSLQDLMVRMLTDSSFLNRQ